MAGWFELSKSSDNQFRFVLKAGNGETILTSELYTSKASAEKGIASVRSNSPQEERYEKKTASNGKFYFNLKAANHQIIGSSQMYATAQSRETGIASVKANGTSQTVKDQYVITMPGVGCWRPALFPNNAYLFTCAIKIVDTDEYSLCFLCLNISMLILLNMFICQNIF
ncbi:protein [Escherichia coli]|nr:protein [Escherichia coli]